jgi:hypothetical protein
MPLSSDMRGLDDEEKQREGGAPRGLVVFFGEPDVGDAVAAQPGRRVARQYVVGLLDKPRLELDGLPPNLALDEPQVSPRENRTKRRVSALSRIVSISSYPFAERV